MLKNNIFALLFNADVAELVDALDLGSSAARCESSSLSTRTKKWNSILTLEFHFFSFKGLVNTIGIKTV